MPSVPRRYRPLVLVVSVILGAVFLGSAWALLIPGVRVRGSDHGTLVDTTTTGAYFAAFLSIGAVVAVLGLLAGIATRATLPRTPAIAALVTITGCAAGWLALESGTIVAVMARSGADVPPGAVTWVAPVLSGGAARLWAGALCGAAAGAVCAVPSLPAPSSRPPLSESDQFVDTDGDKGQ